MPPDAGPAEKTDREPPSELLRLDTFLNVPEAWGRDEVTSWLREVVQRGLAGLGHPAPGPGPRSEAQRDLQPATIVVTLSWGPWATPEVIVPPVRTPIPVRTPPPVRTPARPRPAGRR